MTLGALFTGLLKCGSPLKMARRLMLFRGDVRTSNCVVCDVFFGQNFN